MSRLSGITPLPSPPVITLGSRLSVGCSFLARTGGTTAAATGASPWSDAANCLLAFPFILEAAQTAFYKGFWVNGSSTGGNSEVAIYDGAYNKIISTGSVGNATNSVPQSAAFSSTVTLPPGAYYACMAHDATTTNHFARWTSLKVYYQMVGCWKQASITLGSLPSTATPADMTNAAFPLFGLITRSVFDV
jgi:hypothetical protein